MKDQLVTFLKQLHTKESTIIANQFFDKLNELVPATTTSNYFTSWKEVDVKKQEKTSRFNIKNVTSA